MRSVEVISSYTPEQASNAPIQELVGEENVPVFYEPQEVLKIEGRLSWLAIVAIFAIIILSIPQLAYLEAIIRAIFGGLPGQGISIMGNNVRDRCIDHTVSMLYRLLFLAGPRLDLEYLNGDGIQQPRRCNRVTDF